ncbi:MULTISPECIES: hypothetical protein [unclassified Streptomyces]|uniref:hypothetical protein n=1 Tax=unclassified Streptomyces TaxID=2593676 RepID=UPI0036C97EC3
MPGDSNGEFRRRAEIWGRASGKGHLYQSGGDQQITHVHVRGASSIAGKREGEAEPGLEVLRMDNQLSTLVQVLTLTAAEWQARCSELAAEAQHARAEGRAEALAEVQEQLRESELRVIQAQRMMREAQDERKKTEALLMQAQQEAARRRRAEERRKAAVQGEALPTLMGEGRAEQLRLESAEFTEIMDEAEAQLASLRDELRFLGEEVKRKQQRPGSGVVVGEAVQPRRPEGERVVSSPRRPAALDLSPQRKSPPKTTSQTSAEKQPRTPVQSRHLNPGPARRGRIALHLVICAIPAFVPMLAVTATRAVYAAKPEAWQAVAFTTSSVVVGVVTYAVLGFLAFGASAANLDRYSEDSATAFGAAEITLGAICLLIVALFTPLHWPGPAGEWGQWIAALVGLGG